MIGWKENMLLLDISYFILVGFEYFIIVKVYGKYINFNCTNRIVVFKGEMDKFFKEIKGNISN